ncbi:MULTISPECIES: hypothetical protein [Wolbachia]|uniref:hypothetical protein n=1 Tax=Wolbachia TaxID=953 RepID=UPI0015FB430E|nr:MULTISPECIES: hypothetical protein [Wolbachia]MBA8757079.1 hypothetical protein [Wolbachia pipientis]MDE5058308.1 hypothetical protein [Wolbachia endosymbiont of Drosophila baimaii]
MSTSNLKISIAALSLCVSAVAIYIHLPYVIAAVSGSGAIEAVPLAIFAVSAIVALVSVICLIRLAVSRAGDKKKIDLSGEESGHTASQEPQKLVHENSTDLKSKPIEKESDKSAKRDSESQIKVDSGIDLENKLSVPTSPSQSPQTCNSVPPPPPPPAPNSNGTPPPAPSSNGTSLSAHDNLLKEVKQGIKFISKEERDKVKEKKLKRLENKNKPIGKEPVNTQQVQPTIAAPLISALNAIRTSISPPQRV